MQKLKYLLGRGVLGLDIAVDEHGEIVCRSVDLVLVLGDVELSHQLIQHLDGALVLLGRHVRRCCSGGDGGHVVRGREEEEEGKRGKKRIFFEGRR